MPRGRPRMQRACPYCPRTFSKEDHFSRHVRSHTKEKPFTCSGCGKSFSRYDTLLKHSRTNPSHNALQSGPVTTTPPAATATTATGTFSSFGQVPSTSNLNSLVFDESVYFNANRPVPPRLRAWLETSVYPPTEFVDQRQTPSQDATFTPLEGMLQNPSAIQWDTGLDARVPNWLAGDDFDLKALNSSVLTSATNDTPLLVCNDLELYLMSLQEPSINVYECHEEYHIRQHWFSFIPAGDTGHVIPDKMPEQTEVDDQYREDLPRCLQQRVLTEPLPSIEFLNQCVQMYFTRFSPIFPVVHPSTFRASPKHSLLLLSICSVGSLFVGSDYALAQGSSIFDRLHKAILASWEKYFVKGKVETLTMIQAALIGQTYAVLSGNPRRLLVAQAFHGTVVDWARRCEMFQVRQADDLLPGVGLSARTTEQQWKSWAHAEEQLRVAAGLYIQDTELSILRMSRPALKHLVACTPVVSNDRLWTPVASNDRLWEARNASDWNTLNEERKATTPSKTQSTEVSEFTQFTMLEDCITSIADNRSLYYTGLPKDTRDQFEHWLSQFHDSYLKKGATNSSSPFCLEVLWHSAFLTLYVDFDRLELATGREGYAQSLPHRDYIQKWACSQDGRRCALHGALMLRKAQEMTLGVEPAIHVPRVLYQAAMTWFAYLKFGVDNHDSPKDFPELARLNVNCQALLFESNGFKTSRPKIKESSTLSGLVDLLRRIGHWGISRKFADQLARMMQMNTEDEPSTLSWKY